MQIREKLKKLKFVKGQTKTKENGNRLKGKQGM